MGQVELNRRTLGVTFDAGQKAKIRLWAPYASQVALTINRDSLTLPLTRSELGYWSAETDQLKPGDRYSFVLENEEEFADPASLVQPDGVYGPSQAFDTSAFYWEDTCWVNPPFDEYIIYELDVYTFSAEGTFMGIADKLGYLKALGVNAIVIRPVTPFPDAQKGHHPDIFMYAVQASYGGPGQLQKLVNACHYEGIAVTVDLSYNHVDQQKQYLEDVAARCTGSDDRSRRRTGNNGRAWRQARRQYIVENALMWLRDFHVDALRLNDLQVLPDAEAVLSDIRQQADALTGLTGRHYYLLVEDSPEQEADQDAEPMGGGRPVKADQAYRNYYETDGHTRKAYREDFIYDRQFSSVLRELFGREAETIVSEPSVMFTRPHEAGHGLSATEEGGGQPSFESMKLMAGSILVSPYVPSLFMGDEWGGTNPFVVLTPGEGGTEASADADQDLAAAATDAQPDETNKTLYAYYQALTRLRRQQPALYHLNRKQTSVNQQPDQETMVVHRWYERNDILCLMNFSEEKREITVPALNTYWHKLIDSADPAWLGPEAGPEWLSDGDTTTLQPESILIYKGCDQPDPQACADEHVSV
ncbi:alpha-amylase family glycosyl hydrolase [Spirosoma sp. 209]|uniref:alpha-amylase family glycosyl hydrolase n=1 Tax=Spirosoma sp. 209 TaxID=1955701 RepID=UPI0013747EBF|nr:alpha-amylase family glycosyl hydrolase [Spirosoma sp. 209]